MSTIDRQLIIRMIIGAAENILDHHTMLSKLDAATGDGDHGTSMQRAMTAVRDTVNTHPDEPLPTLLHKIGWAIMSIDGGSTGPLLGSFFMGMSKCPALEAPDLTVEGVAQMLAEGIQSTHKQSRAQVGDKTMMDAMLPALEALAASPPADSLTALLEQAARAAAKGAEATAEMTAKFGRARNLGDRVLGHRDPGAVSVSLIFQGFLNGVRHS